MPYYVHYFGTPFNAETSYRNDGEHTMSYSRYSSRFQQSTYSAESAHEYKLAMEQDSDGTEKYQVTFCASEQELTDFHEREAYKVRDDNSGGYSRVPWHDEPWQQELDKLHYAYLSIEAPGMIAYTPSIEHGVTDRQIRLRPGRYLERFASHLSQVERDTLCARVKAFEDAQTFEVARTAREIEKVYRQGPHSCMSHSASDFESHVHPATVYGDSDIQVAYLPHRTREDSYRARAVIWESEKLYGRIYGDVALRLYLERKGFKSADTFDGAKVRVIEHDDNDCYVMPYLDCGDCVEFSHDRQWFIVRAHDYNRRSTTYCARNTNGLTLDPYEQEQETYTCANGDCDNEVDSEGDTCSWCQDNEYTCALCNDTFYEESPRTAEAHDDENICRGCYRNRREMCAHPDCSAYYFADLISRTDSRLRDRYTTDETSVNDYCPNCANDAIQAARDAETLAAQVAERNRLAHEKRSLLVYALAKAMNARVHRSNALDFNRVDEAQSVVIYSADTTNEVSPF